MKGKENKFLLSRTDAPSLKMVTNCRGHHAVRVMVAHLADGPRGGAPQKYFVWFRLGRVKGFRISSLCTNVPVYMNEVVQLVARTPRARAKETIEVSAITEINAAGRACIG